MTEGGNQDRRGADAPDGATDDADTLRDADAALPPASVPPDPKSLVGQVIADRYRVQSLLGVGGMGSVYRGEHVHMRNAVALKVLHPELVLVPEICSRFEREAIAAARITDGHVVAATDFGKLEDGSFYLALEFVEGRELDEVLAHGALDQLRALKIARQIVVALVAAHAAGIIHRDLKPQNVMLIEKPDDPDYVKVLDFGIAKVTVDDRPSLNPHGHVLTQLGTVFGTPQYMAPEQATGSEVDHRADLYTVGVLLYEMLTGREPFNDDELTEVLRMQISDPPPPLPAALNHSLVELVMTQLSKDPAERSQSAEELLAWIDRVLQEFSVLAPLPDVASAVREWSASSPEGPSLAGVASRASQASYAAITAPSGLPWWAVLLPVVLLLGGGAAAAGAWFWWSAAKQEAADARAAEDAAPPSDSAAMVRRTPLDAELLAKAATGDPKAIEMVEQRPAKDRAAPDWVALARGRMQLERYMSALDAYSRALDLDPALTRDRVLLSHVRKAASLDETAEPALRIAAVRLGSDGADVLYSVWVATKAKTDTTQLAKQLVYSREVRSRATPALAIALDLREAEACEDVRGLLARATLHGDTRAFRILKPLVSQRGCGDKELEDCYECLREGSSLTDAIAATRTRPEPAFLAR